MSNLKIAKLLNLDQDTIAMLGDLCEHYGIDNQSEVVRRLIRDRYKRIGETKDGNTKQEERSK